MFWRLKRSEFEKQKGEGNRKAFKSVVDSGEPPGLLAYCEGKPIAWCAVAPRAEYTALERSRILKPIDDQPVWSISCLFVARPYRRKGVTVQLVKAAARHALSRGARIVEAYPVEPLTGCVPDAFAWHGFASAFRKAGFKECARRSETRPIMRYARRARD
jgi:GNAT superfamily N-acetyltransferase